MKRLVVISATLVALVSAGVMAMIGSAVTAGNTVPESKLTASNNDPGVNDLKPNECNSTTQTARTTGTGLYVGTAASEVMFGSAVLDQVVGDAGDDCILGGGSIDDIQGSDGNDVLLGGPGDDALEGGLGTDVCYGGGGIDTFVSCETQVQ